jgi:hypothetical protein
LEKSFEELSDMPTRKLMNGAKRLVATAKQRNRKDRDSFRKHLAKALAQATGDARIPCPECSGVKYSGYWTEKGPKIRCWHCGRKDFADSRLQEAVLGALGYRCSCGGKLKSNGEILICTCGKSYNWNQIAV